MFIQGQWWSIKNTHRSQTLQWCVRAGLTSLHLLQDLFIKLTSSIVFYLYLSNYFTSFEIPSNLSFKSSSRYFSTDFRWVLFLYLCLSCSMFLNSLGPVGSIIIAKKWLYTTLNPTIKKIACQTNVKLTPSLFPKAGTTNV